MNKLVLEAAAQAVAEQTSQPPFFYQLTPDEARKALDDIQAAPIAKPDVDDKWITVTDAAQDTSTYKEFAEGPYLRAKTMEWFWDAYAPDVTRRGEITASPLLASSGELAGLPPAFLLVDEGDVLRDEGGAYAANLRKAGVPTVAVRYNGIIHDFMMLNPVRETQAATSAINQAIAILRQAFGTD